MSLGMSRGAAPVPPDKGSFPLDRKGQCKADAKAFLDCIQQHDAKHGKCRTLSKKYLECRMQRGLMKEESFDTLGYHRVSDFEYTGGEASVNDHDKGKRGAGFLAGLGVNDIGERFQEQQRQKQEQEQRT